MNWEEKKVVLNRLGHSRFDSEEEYNEWRRELDNPIKSRIDKAICNAEENVTPSFDWSRAYFKIEEQN